MRGFAVFAPLAVVAALAGTLSPTPAAASVSVLIDATTGRVLKADNATYPWYPASVTKLMTAYVTLRAIKEGRLGFDTLITVSPNAMAQPPSKMGLRTGIRLTVDNALKMLMVKSANDIAVVVAEGVSGSVEKFADEMNLASRRLGMTQSSWVNPHGLPAEGQITSARDMAILARALLREFPDLDGYWNISAIRLGRRVIRNTNAMFMNYPGADGMKTGFICASGFNLVASVTRGDRRLIAVVLGAPSSSARAVKAAQLFDQGFGNTGLGWLMPAGGSVEQMAAVEAEPPNLRDEMCGKNRRRPATEDATEVDAAPNGEPGGLQTMLFGAAAGPQAVDLSGAANGQRPIIDVWVGPNKPSATAVAARGAKPDPAVSAIVSPKKKKPSAATAVIVPENAAVTATARKPRPKPTADKNKIGAEPTLAAKPVSAKTLDLKPGAAKPTASKPADAKPADKPGAASPTAAKPKPKPSADAGKSIEAVAR